VIIHIQNVGGIGLGQPPIAANNCQILIIVVRTPVAEIMATRDDQPVVGEWIYNKVLSVNNGKAGV